jgi:hypothetical protein
MSNVKAGDLAIVTRTCHTPEALGRLVVVIRPAVSGEVFEGKVRFIPAKNEPHWVCRCVAERPIQWRLSTGKLFEVSEAVFLGKNLRPVSGLPDTEDTDTEQPIKDREPA